MPDTEPLKLVPATTALVVIDLQKGILERACGPHESSAVLARSIELADAVRARGGLVVLVRVAFSPDMRDVLRPISDDPTLARASAPAADWAELAPELGPRPNDHLVTKHQWGAFHGTDLDLQLRRRAVETIVLCGIATCFGVESTARVAWELGYQQVFVEDAMSSLTAEGHAHTITRIFPRLGRVRSTAQVLAALA